MIEETRPALIDRAAERPDLRALTAEPVPCALPTSDPVTVQATGSSEEVLSGRTIGDEKIIAVDAPARPLNKCASPSQARLRELVSKMYGGVRSKREGADAANELRAPRQADALIRFNRPRLRKLALIDWAAGRTRAAEELRLIKRELLEQAADPDRYGPRSNLIMITSARPGEGRTFTALNLAISITMERNWQVLLVDTCDDENTVASVIDTLPRMGWLDLVEDPTREIPSAVSETDIPGLSLMLPGRRQGGTAEAVGSGNMQRLLKELAASNRNRVVLIDAPSCLDTSDAATLARVVGQTVLVVEAHATQQQRVEAALDLLRSCENIYLVLNKSRTS
jgi:protein-tyrosine kinase